MPELSRDEVMSQLGKITSSSDFPAGPRVKKFLIHLVTEELEGRGEHLKGTALAMDVFGRGVDFDSNNDPVVRIEAVKLRKALEHYYLTSGSEDGIEIGVPKGQYRPAFTKSEPKARSERRVSPSSLPAIGILPFEGSDTEMARVYRMGLPEEVALELSRFDHLLVFSGWKQDGEPGPASRSASACDYMLKGTVRDADGRMRITAQLSRESDGLLVWSDRFDINQDSDDVFDVQERIARQCATRLADAYGVVAEDLGAQYSGRQATNASVYEALLAFQAHMRTSRSDSLHEFLDLAQGALRDNPKSGLAHALIALGCLEKLTMGEARLSDILTDGNRHAERAVSLAPQCQEALFSAAVFALLNKDELRFNRLVKAAVKANPNGSLLISMAGGWIMVFGDIETGADLVRSANADNPILPVWTNISLSMLDVAEGRYTEASAKVRNVDARDCAGDWLMIAVAHALAKETELAEQALNRAEELGLQYKEYLADLPITTELEKTAQMALSALK